jgi:hypothetical protein
MSFFTCLSLILSIFLVFWNFNLTQNDFRFAPKEDPNLHVATYVRTPEQCELLGVPYLTESEIQRNEELKAKDTTQHHLIATIPQQTQHKVERNINMDTTTTTSNTSNLNQSSTEKPKEQQVSKSEPTSEWRPKKSNVGVARLGILRFFLLFHTIK